MALSGLSRSRRRAYNSCMEQEKPILAITLGDPAGVGPEVVAAAWSSPELHAVARPVAIGHPAVLRRAVKLRGSSANVIEIDRPEDAEPTPLLLPCLGAVHAADAGQEGEVLEEVVVTAPYGGSLSRDRAWRSAFSRSIWTHAWMSRSRASMRARQASTRATDVAAPDASRCAASSAVKRLRPPGPALRKSDMA